MQTLTEETFRKHLMARTLISITAMITPAMAAYILDYHNQANRKRKQPVVKRYERDMRAGNWVLNPDGPITFGLDGQLINGQHRLSAIFECGLEQPFVIWFGCSPETKSVCDGHVPRNLQDTLVLSGTEVDRRVTEIARYMLERQQLISKPTTAEMKQFLSVYRDSVEWANAHFPKRMRGVSQACVAAAIATAYYHVPLEYLESFSTILNEGTYTEPHAITIITLRNLLLREGGSSSGHRRLRFNRLAQRAIKAYVAHEALTKMYTIEYDIYPLPTEDELTRPLQPELAHA